MNIEQKTINQLKTLFIHSEGSTASTVQIWFRAGSALENDSNEGIAHFLEHMFFKGTPTRTGPKLAFEVEGQGAEFNAFTSFDYTCYYINSPARSFKNCVEILMDMVTNPLFSEEEIPMERDVVFEEYRRALDNPSQFNFMELQKLAFTTGYAHPILGREDTIKNFTRDQITEFRNKFYNLENAMLVVAGDLKDQHDFEDIIKKYKMPDGQKSEFPKFQLKNKTSFGSHEKDIRQATLTMVIDAPAYSDKLSAAQDLAINCLAHGETSALYQALVPGNSICNGVSGSSMYFANGGSHFIRFSFPIENLPKLTKVYEQLITKVLNEGFSDKEVQKIKNQYISSKVYEKESIEAFAFSLGHGFAQTGNIHCEEEFINNIKETSATDVHLAYSEIFSKPVHFCLQVPKGKISKAQQTQLLNLNKKIESVAKKIKSKEKTKHKIHTTDFDPSVKMLEIMPGIKFVYRQNKMTPTFILHTYIKGGVTVENANNIGSHNMLSRLFTYGYKGCDYLKLKYDLEHYSASLGGFSGKNAYGLVMHGQSKDLDLLFNHFKGTLKSPALPPKYYDHEKKVLKRILDNQKEDPVKQCFKTFYAMVFNQHPYGLDAAGSEHSLKKMSLTKLKAIHNSSLQKNEMIITYMGDQNFDKILPMVKEMVLDLKPRPVKKPKNKLKPIIGKHIKIEMKREQTQIVIGTSAFKMGDKNDLYLKMLSTHLSGQSSELFLEVRDNQGLCYAVQAVHLAALEAGCFGIYIGAGNDKKDKAIKAIKDILDRIAEKGLSLDEFNRIKFMIEGQNQLAIQTNDDFANYYSIAALHGLGLDYQHNQQKTIQSLDYNEFQKFLNKFLKSKWNIIEVGVG
jgi:zinc protease